MRTVLVTASDAGFFPLLVDMLTTVHEHRPNADMSIAVMDVGLLPEQIEQLKPLVDRIIVPEWDVDFSAQDIAPAWYRAMTARPFLPKHLPEYELFVWIDSDAWLQDWRAIDLLLGAAAPDCLAIVPELHRGYRYLYNQGNVRQNVYECVKPAFGEHVAMQLAAMPILSSGVFALKRDAPHWNAWADLLRQALLVTPPGGPIHRLTEQCAINLAVYLHNLPVHYLPAWCNWICGHGIPIFDRENRWLAEKYLPYEKLSIVHLTDLKNLDVNVPTPTREKLTRKLNYSDFKNWRETS